MDLWKDPREGSERFVTVCLLGILTKPLPASFRFLRIRSAWPMARPTEVSGNKKESGRGSIRPRLASVIFTDPAFVSRKRRGGEVVSTTVKGIKPILLSGQFVRMHRQRFNVIPAHLPGVRVPAVPDEIPPGRIPALLSGFFVPLLLLSHQFGFSFQHWRHPDEYFAALERRVWVAILICSPFALSRSVWA